MCDERRRRAAVCRCTVVVRCCRRHSRNARNAACHAETGYIRQHPNGIIHGGAFQGIQRAVAVTNCATYGISCILAESRIRLKLLARRQFGGFAANFGVSTCAEATGST